MKRFSFLFKAQSLRLLSFFVVLVLLSFPKNSYAVDYNPDDEDYDDFEEVDAEMDTLSATYAFTMDSIFRLEEINFSSHSNFINQSLDDSIYYAHQRVASTAENSERINLLIIITDYLFDRIGESILQYSDDIYHGVGYSSTIETIRHGTHSQVRELIQSYYSGDLLGVLLVGDIPCAYYEQVYRDSLTFWPCDLYYMDLDGYWYDNDGNGIYDEHQGNVHPEVFVSRIMTHTFRIYGSEEDLMLDYFSKNHNYWAGMGPDYANALAYTSKDWVRFSDFGRRGLRYLFGASNYTKLEEGVYNSFGKSDYLHQNQYNYSLIQLAAHSNPRRHRIMNNYGGADTLISTTEIMSSQTYALSYNLFCCSVLDWTVFPFTGYIGGSYLFNSDNTLTVVGSTKSGSMLKFRHFYRALSNGATMGRAFLKWFIVAPGLRHDDYDIHWFYGMSIHGDPCIMLAENDQRRVSRYMQDDKDEQIDDQNCIYRIYDIDGQLIQEGNNLDVLKKMSHGLFIIQEINNNRTDVYKVSR